MADLFSEYFRRDLSDKELDQLEAWLQGPQENAQRFSEQAAGFYRSLGLSEGRLPGGGAPGLGTVLGVVLGAALAGAAWLNWPDKGEVPPAEAVALPDLNPVPVLPKSTPPAKVVVKSTLSSKPSRLLFATPEPGGDERKFGALGITLELPDRREIQVRVLDDQGTEKSLYQGRLDKGSWHVPWDGRFGAAAAKPGIYTIEVRSGDWVMTKQVKIESGQ